MKPNELTGAIIRAAMLVHTELSPGCLESTYRTCLCGELDFMGIQYEAELVLPVTYRSLTIDKGYRIDILVEDLVIVETKAVSKMTEVHESQLLSYLRLKRRPLGLLINFHVKHLRHGIKRMVNDYRGPRMEDPA